MTVTTPITLPDCPAALQSMVWEKQSEDDSEILSITRTESTPFKDKSIVSIQYRVIMNRLNLITVLHCQVDGVLKDKVFVNSLIWGDVLEIIRTAPDGSSLAELRHRRKPGNSYPYSQFHYSLVPVRFPHRDRAFLLPKMRRC